MKIEEFRKLKPVKQDKLKTVSKENFRCSFVYPSGARCKALRYKLSPKGYCYGHSRQEKEEIIIEDLFKYGIVESIESGLFKNLFDNSEGNQESWNSWKIILNSIFGKELDTQQLEIFKTLTGRSVSSKKQVQEVYILAGRRSGKSWISAAIAVYLSLFRKYKNLRKGEKGHFVIVSPTRTHSQVIMSYIKAILNSKKEFREQVKKTMKEEVEFKNGISISVRTSNIIGSRGLTIIGCILDEACFFPKDDSANPDSEIIAGILPAMATIKNSILISISSPYSKQGVSFEKWEKYFGIENDKVLVVQAASRQLNPTLSEKWIQEQLDDNFEVNRAEYLAQWRANVSAFFSEDIIERAVDLTRPEIIPFQSDKKYYAFVDGASGSSGSKSGDSFSMSVGHKEKEEVIIDGVWETRPPFSAKSVIESYCSILKSYKVRTVLGDKWALGVLGDLFRIENIIYTTSKLSASELYQESSVFFNHGIINIPDIKRLKNQMRGLERHVRTSGKDKVTHSPGSHDDLINSVSGVVCHILLGLHLDLDSPEIQARLPVLKKTSKSSLDRLAPWELQALEKENKIFSIIDKNGRSKYIRSTIE